MADNDGDGLLTLQEFMETMNLRSVQHYLKILDVTVNDSRSLAPKKARPNLIMWVKHGKTWVNNNKPPIFGIVYTTYICGDLGIVYFCFTIWVCLK